MFDPIVEDLVAILKARHSIRNCPLTGPNMKKILGDSRSTRLEEKYYSLVRNKSWQKGCHNVDQHDHTERFYTRLPHCPNVGQCQTFGQWKFQMLTSKINRMFAQRSFKQLKLLLYFLPIGPFPEFVYSYRQPTAKMSLFELLCEFVGVFFNGSEVRLLPEFDISNVPATSRHHKLTGKLQYYVSDILSFLRRQLPPDGFAIIGLTWNDLYPSENLNFVLGQGSSQHSACVASFGRFDPNYVKGFKGREDGIEPCDMKDIEEITEEVLWKLLKVISHETCHVLGVSHCQVFECLMNSSSSTEEALSQPLNLCPLCMSKIQNLKFSLCRDSDGEKLSVESHFSGLLTFLKTVFKTTSAEDASAVEMRAGGVISWLDRMTSYLSE